MDVAKFRSAIIEDAGIELTPLDIFVLYNLSGNDNMATHIEGIGFKVATKKLVEWMPLPRPTTIQDYRGLILAISNCKGTAREVEADTILREMEGIYTDFAWVEANVEEKLKFPEDVAIGSSMYYFHIIYDYISHYIQVI